MLVCVCIGKKSQNELFASPVVLLIGAQDNDLPKVCILGQLPEQLIKLASIGSVSQGALLLGLGLDAECKSMSAAGPQTHWEKRCHLFGRTRIPAPLRIPDNVLPVGLGTIKFRHLQRIWNTFKLRDAVLPDMSLRGRLEEITDKRMAISHGRESAAEVGRRYSFDELAKRHTAIDLVCSHLVQSFETYLASERYRFP